jgi:hypothetical protein
VTTATPPAGSSPVAIAGLGVRLPDRLVTNDELAQVMDTSDEWIRTRTGIRQRYVAAPEEATSDLATAAARAALADAGLRTRPADRDHRGDHDPGPCRGGDGPAGRRRARHRPCRPST